MKKFMRIIVLLAIPVMLLTNCKKTAEEQNKYQTLADYLVAEHMDLSEVISYHGDGAPEAGLKFVTAVSDAASAQAIIDKYYIMDIRTAGDFSGGHIEGAVNVAFGDILTEAAKAGSKPILVVCYTGQTACFATSLLRLYGYPLTQALKWGMSGWSSSKDSWTIKIGNAADGHANWTTAAAPTNQAYASPVVISDMESGSDVLMERVEAVVAEGFGAAKVAGTDVLDNPGNYFINNYFSETDYTGFGHIDGANRINPLKLGDGSISYLDPDKTVVTYCYTGQTSAVITAYLRVLGYDAKSMLFGMNGIYNSNAAWTSNKWSASVSKDHPLQ